MEPITIKRNIKVYKILFSSDLPEHQIMEHMDNFLKEVDAKKMMAKVIVLEESEIDNLIKEF